MTETVVKFERHISKTDVECVSGSMALLHQLLWLFADEPDVENFQKSIACFKGYKKYVALGLLESHLTRVLIFDERLYDAGWDLRNRWYNIGIHLVTIKDERLCVWWEEGNEDFPSPNEGHTGRYDFILCHESMLEKLKEVWKLDKVCTGLDGDDGGGSNGEPTVVSKLQKYLVGGKQKGRLVIHTGRGKPDKILERRSTKDVAESELDDLRFTDFVNLRYALMNGKYFLVQLLYNLRRSPENG